jgi:hypothetical protein
MAESFYNIGGRIISVDWPEAYPTVEPFAGLRPFRTEPASPDYRILYGCEVAQVDGAVVYNQFRYAEIDSLCTFAAKDNLFVFTMRESFTGTVLLNMHYRQGEKVVYSSSCSNLSALRFSLWFALGMLTARDKMSFVHSSAIVYNGRAVLFLGESGTGKSTHASLWLDNVSGSHILNDDSPVLSTASGMPIVYGSPWSGKRPFHIQRHFPLAAVVRLSQAPQNAMRRLSIPAAFAALQPSLPPALMQDERYADLLIGIISDTISAVPSYHLACLPDDEAARLSCKTIFDNAL